MAIDGDLVFTPVLQNRDDGIQRDADDRSTAAAIKTYRYLRLGMVAVVVAILVSIQSQHALDGFWESSVSDYYYTHARPVFVAGLIATALALIAIKGNTTGEDTALNVAGMLAPIVAFVPTGSEQLCDGAVIVDDTICLDVDNNIKALLVAGVVGVGIAAFSLVIERWKGHVSQRTTIVQALLLVATTGLLAFGWWALRSGNIYGLHATAAIAMFVALGIAAVWAGGDLLWRNRKKPPEHRSPRHAKGFAWAYFAVAAAMGIGGLVIYKRPGEWQHRILVLELYETVLFASVWIVQSAERWGKVVR